LLQSAIQIVADSKTNTLRMIFSRHNWAMRKLAAKAGGTLDMILGEIAVDVAVSGSGARSTAQAASMQHLSERSPVDQEGGYDGGYAESFRVSARVGKII
jgi:hypothetical protein